VNVPTLVMAGDRDTLAPLEASRWLAATMRDARLCVIAGAAHAPFLSHPHAVQSAIASFLRDG
jgi:pimeloyl-[acyl-carrier protein] methyl ester esterase